MKKFSNTRKFTLQAETIRALQQPQLAQVAGGADFTLKPYCRSLISICITK